MDVAGVAGDVGAEVKDCYYLCTFIFLFGVFVAAGAAGAASAGWG